MPLALRALLLVLLCLIPAAAVQIALEQDARAERGAELGEMAARLARLVANQQVRNIEGAQQLMAAIAAHDAIRAVAPSEECDAFLTRIIVQYPRYNTANLFGLDGQLVCSGTAMPRSVNVRDRPYFQRILDGAWFTVGEYAVGRGTGVASLHLAGALLGDDRALRGVLVLAMSVDWLNDDLATLALPRGSAASIADRDGVLIARAPDGARFAGMELPADLRRMVDAPHPAVTEAQSVDGVRRVVAYLPQAEPPAGLLVAVGIDAAPQIAAALWRDRRATLLIVGSLMTSLALAIAAFHLGVERPVRQLLAAAQAWSRQDWRARVGRIAGGSEFARLGAALDDMAEALSRAEAERNVAAARMKALSDVSPQVVFTADSRGRPDWFNRSWRELTGQDVADAAGAGWLRCIHREDRGRAVAAWRTLQRSGGEAELPDLELRVCRSADRSWRWFLFRAAPIRRADGSIDSWAGVALDVHELRMAREEAADQAARLDATYQNAPVGLCLLDVQLRFVAINAVLAAANGAPPEAHLGRSLGEMAPRIAPALEPRLRAVTATGRAVGPFELEVPGGDPSEERRWWLCQYQPVRDQDGAVSGVAGSLLDITERKRAEQTQALLAREVDHRARNVLAVVRSLVRISAAEQPDDVEALVEALEGRIAAMARVHTLLAEERWAGADLRNIVAAETAAHAARIEAAGPRLRLAPGAAQPAAMVLHELVTNAAKHGALSCAGGRIAIAWERDAEGAWLRWTERGGPPLEGPPRRHGFGSQLIDLNVAGPLAGSIERAWDAEGLRCAIRIGGEALVGGVSPDLATAPAAG